MQHRIHPFRGVIFDVDPVFSLTEAWYEQVARSRPPRDAPWYYVFVHNGIHETYVAERNLEPDESAEPVRNPRVDEHFKAFHDGRYVRRRRGN